MRLAFRTQHGLVEPNAAEPLASARGRKQPDRPTERFSAKGIEASGNTGNSRHRVELAATGCRAPWKTAPSASRGIAPSSDS